VPICGKKQHSITGALLALIVVHKELDLFNYVCSSSLQIGAFTVTAIASHFVFCDAKLVPIFFISIWKCNPVL
jgi:NADH:ubiquinone oxidoreductase subunit 4 (subunit M)